MRKILIFFYNLKPIWQFTFFFLLSIVILMMNPAKALYPIKANGVSLISEIRNITSYVKTNRSLKKENAELKKQLIKEIFLKNYYHDRFQENNRLRRLLKIPPLNDFNYIFAQVVGSSPYIGIKAFLINKGKNDSINANDPVISTEGLVGKILEVYDHSSLVEILPDRNIKISAKILRNNERGILKFYNEDLLLLDYIPKTISVIVGDMVVTSEISQIYPPGIKIGEVVAIDKKPQEHFQKVYVLPYVNFNNVNEILILKEK
ncbi:MAG: rod shape-determining protein MreC [Calditrichia bacterium]